MFTPLLLVLGSRGRLWRRRIWRLICRETTVTSETQLFENGGVAFPSPVTPNPIGVGTARLSLLPIASGVPIPVNSPYLIWGHCLVWRYSLNGEGYGRQRVDGREELAHRVAYIQTRGQIPEGKQINHLCNRPYCVQPSHLYAGTDQDNKDDSRIFTKHELFAAPGVMHRYTENRPDDPFRQRLLEFGPVRRNDLLEPG